MQTITYNLRFITTRAKLLTILWLLLIHGTPVLSIETDSHDFTQSTSDLHNANSIFRFLESQFSDILYPSQITNSTNGIYYRVYPMANLSLCIMDNSLFLLEDTGGIGVWHNVGTVKQWLDIIAGQPVFTIHPQNQIMPDYLSIPPPAVTFRARATGISPLKYQWQVSSSFGIIWEDIPDATDKTLTVYRFSDHDVDGLLFRCRVTGTYSSVSSTSALLRHARQHSPSIVSHPADQVMPDYLTSPAPYVTFRANAEGDEPLHYQWQVGRFDAESVLRWTNIKEATETSLRIYALTDLSDSGTFFRCRVTNRHGAAITTSARIFY
ncbi:immunoglobulin domain-containing protein [Desulfonatronovibrio magnus]|uniref:immunoglobulin domain-containing protein n=1 Tax=Desulfonatronovibrio magnus TaxID=698827 RepID=UPI0005EB091A|nr:hypothetical protein [Desulfonatronovibrio magnus]